MNLSNFGYFIKRNIENLRSFHLLYVINLYFLLLRSIITNQLATVKMFDNVQ